MLKWCFSCVCVCTCGLLYVIHIGCLIGYIGLLLRGLLLLVCVWVGLKIRLWVCGFFFCCRWYLRGTRGIQCGSSNNHIHIYACELLPMCTLCVRNGNHDFVCFFFCFAYLFAPPSHLFARVVIVLMWIGECLSLGTLNAQLCVP